MKFVILLILTLMIYTISLGNMVWIYRKTKNGITLVANGGSTGGEDSTRIHKTYDAFLDYLNKKLNRKTDNNLKILLLLDVSGFMIPSYDKWFATIAFDTLREVDWDFIEDYFGPKYDRKSGILIVTDVKPGKEPIPEPLEPVDLNSSYNTSNKDIGLKIHYSCYTKSDSANFFDRVYSLVQYGVDNIEKIKTDQGRIYMEWRPEEKVSLLSFDTSKIQRIPLSRSGFDPNKINSENNSGKFIWIASIVILIGVVAFLIRAKLQVGKS